MTYLEQKIINAMTQKEPNGTCKQCAEILNEYLAKITAAINPVSNIALPFVLASLQIAEQAMKMNMKADEVEIAMALQNLGKAVSVVMPDMSDEC